MRESLSKTYKNRPRVAQKHQPSSSLSAPTTKSKMSYDELPQSKTDKDGKNRRRLLMQIHVEDHTPGSDERLKHRPRHLTQLDIDEDKEQLRRQAEIERERKQRIPKKAGAYIEVGQAEENVLLHRRFREKTTFEERKEETDKLAQEHPGMVPVVVERYPTARESEKTENLHYRKFLAVSEITVTDFIWSVKKYISTAKRDSLFFYMGDMMTPYSWTMGEVARITNSKDGFLYIMYGRENTFG